MDCEVKMRGLVVNKNITKYKRRYEQKLVTDCADINSRMKPCGTIQQNNYKIK